MTSTQTSARTNDRLTFDGFRSEKHFPALDGLRAVAVLLVITVHIAPPSPGWLWAHFDFSCSVPIFFILSGFLITTLALRELRRNGRVNLKAFYIRRLFRLTPLYLTTLVLYGLVLHVLGGEGIAQRRADFYHRLPFFLLYLNEYAQVVYPGSPVLGHTWTLGIEEKFYALWPLISFRALSTRMQRVVVATSLVAIFWTLEYVLKFPHAFGGSYGELLLGCLIAILLDSEKGFNALAVLGKPAIQSVVMLLWIGFVIVPGGYTLRRSALYAVSLALAQTSLLIRPRGLWGRALEAPVLTYIGRRSYGIYLMHILCANAISKLPAFNRPGALNAFSLYFAVVAASVAIAEVLFRTIESPFTALGRKLGDPYRGTPAVRAKG